MPKNYWYEVYCFMTNKTGTETLETFETLGDAQQFINSNSNRDLYVDEWEMNEDGTGLTFRNLI